MGLTFLTIMILFDTYINRRFLRKWGAKICMGSDSRKAFKNIKMCKKQKKWLKNELDDLHEYSYNETERKLVQGLKVQLMSCNMGKPLDKVLWQQFKQ
mmetsp:Transcript_11391/g.15326  ORF Transcript_11391/g.15326 Transcript_11391/m.15326 type:complete len:98 (+) Transcript_11391:356-649(+)